jgi:hypothetical protein
MLFFLFVAWLARCERCFVNVVLCVLRRRGHYWGVCICVCVRLLHRLPPVVDAVAVFAAVVAWACVQFLNFRRS